MFFSFRSYYMCSIFSLSLSLSIYISIYLSLYLSLSIYLSLSLFLCYYADHWIWWLFCWFGYPCRWQIGGEKADAVAVLVHMTPQDIIDSDTYQTWMKSWVRDIHCLSRSAALADIRKGDVWKCMLGSCMCHQHCTWLIVVCSCRGCCVFCDRFWCEGICFSLVHFPWGFSCRVV